ncbi:MAG: heparin lyase I family protein [Bacteroidota bacterium]
MLITCMVLVACHREEQPSGTVVQFSEDFESYAAFDSTVFAEEKWSGLQQTMDGNGFSIDTVIVHSGNRSLKCFAVQSPPNNVSKTSLRKGNFYFKIHDVIRYSGWYYVSGPLTNLFIVDFEEPAEISSSPGVRVALFEEGYLALERGKIMKGTIYQNESVKRMFPVNQWVHVEVEMQLERKKKGYVKIWQDGVLLIDQDRIQTVPKDFIYFTQGTAGFLNSLEVGITANGQSGSTILYIDDVSIRKIN